MEGDSHARVPEVRATAPAFVVAVILAVLAAPAHGSSCDPQGTDAAALAVSRASIDAACPCDSATSRSSYRACALDAVDAQITGNALARACRSEALQYAKRSRCGRIGATVCCRITTGGRESHRVASDASRCRAPSGGTACTSPYQSVVTACDASGCVPLYVCGNGAIDDGEQCDSPDSGTCDATCWSSCTEPADACGNGTLDVGEACEPPGTATCDRNCQTAACPPALPGETLLACIDDEPRVAAASNGTDYLAAWNARLHRTATDVLARRLGASGSPVDAQPLIVSDGASCFAHTQVTLSSDATDYGVAWYGSFPYREAVFSREITAGGTTTGPPVTLAWLEPIGQCRDDYIGPVTSAALGRHDYAVLWRLVASCAPGGILFQDPVGVRAPLPAGYPLPELSLGFADTSPPAIFSGGPATVASLGTDTLAAWPVSDVTAAFEATPYVEAAWIEADASVTKFSLGSAHWVSGFGPTVAAGDASFLVAWGDSADLTPASLHAIRARRVTRADGPLGADGGFVVATSSDRIVAGPAVSFDGAVWLVAWVEANGASYDLRAAAVRPDGSVVDFTPRVLATGVAALPAALASRGAGTHLALFARDHGSGVFGVYSLTEPGS